MPATSPRGRRSSTLAQLGGDSFSPLLSTTKLEGISGMRVTEEERGIPRRGPGRILKQSPKASSCRLSNTTSSHVRTAFRPMVSGPRKTASLLWKDVLRRIAPPRRTRLTTNLPPELFRLGAETMEMSPFKTPCAFTTVEDSHSLITERRHGDGDAGEERA